MMTISSSKAEDLFYLSTMEKKLRNSILLVLLCINVLFIFVYIFAIFGVHVKLNNAQNNIYMKGTVSKFYDKA